jgi:hypothetical protein
MFVVFIKLITNIIHVYVDIKLEKVEVKRGMWHCEAIQNAF